MVPTYSMMGPFRGHMSLKSSQRQKDTERPNELPKFNRKSLAKKIISFSPGLSCKLSNQHIIQDHMAAHYKKLMSAKAAVDSSAPKSLHTSVKYKDQQKRDRLIQALEKYKKNLAHGLPASLLNSRSGSSRQQKESCSLLENGHLCLISGQNNCYRTKKEQPHSVSIQKLTSKTLMPAPTARKNIQNIAQHALSQIPVHSSSTDRSPVSPHLQSRMHLGSHNRKKAVQTSSNKTYSGDLLDKHSIYFTAKEQCFTPQILKTSNQSFLIKYRYYNPPPPKKCSSAGRPSLKSADINDEKKRDLHRLLEDADVRPHSVHFSQQLVENYELRIPDSEMPLSSGPQLEELEEEYLHFLQDLTNDILIRSCFHKEALEDAFQMHIKSRRHNLDEVKRRRIVQSLKKELNIMNQPDPSISYKGAWQTDTSIPTTCS